MGFDEAILRVGAISLSEAGDQPVLLRRAKQGDLEAFESLMRAHERAVLRLAFRLLGSAEDAEDVGQEVFLKLHRHIGSLDEERLIGPWLYSVTVNLCRDALRRRRLVAPIDASLAASLRPLDEQIEIEQRRRILAEALDGLTPGERAALVMRDVEGRTTAAVAEALGTAEGTVRAHISHARLKLRKLVEELMRRKK